MLLTTLVSIVFLQTKQPQVYETRRLVKWEVKINRVLLDQQAEATKKALGLLEIQLKEIEAKLPATAVAKLRKVTLWMSPEYPNTPPRAEYHPGPGWLKENGRNVAMAKGVEITNVRIFEEETKRMPNFALHELAHAYHDRFLPKGFENEEVKKAYEAAKASKGYDRVERQDAKGKRTLDKAYAMVNPMEYFAETTEAFFSQNDFFPFNSIELKKHDPAMHDLLKKLWEMP